MKYNSLKTIGSGVLLMGFSLTALGHGLMVDPPARNAHCGVNEKPDTATSPACVEAFQNDFNGGYQFMSVLTHDIGRKGGTSTNVCGFDSETWDGGATPWDVATNWPTTNISGGALDITWDISWGPHFDDTEEFVYYITKPDFQFDPNRPLSWSDFESEPFCDLRYDDSNPSANPNITTEKGSSLFHTRCNVPSRSGRHVIYGEWGRNHFTYERFHGCIDVSFGGGSTSSSSTSSGSTTSGSTTSSSGGTSTSTSSSGSTSTSSSSSGGTSTTSSSSGGTSTSSSSTSSSGGTGGSATCDHVISNEWGSGFTGAVRITNTSNSTINGWEVNWEYTDGAVITSSWNASVAGSNPYTASSLGWNGSIAPGDTVEFGFQGETNGGSVQVSEVTGDICN